MKITTTNYQKKMGWLILVSITIKIFLSLFLELGNDEVYYYTYALQPDWSHFDHPPMVGWMIQLFTFNLTWVTDVSMRLGSIVVSAISVWIIFETGTLLKDEKSGWIAALLYSLSIYTNIIAGMFVMPDSPQLLFFCFSIYLMVRYVIQPTKFTLVHWVLLGLCIGLATLSKVHGLYLWFGFGLFILTNQVKTLKIPGLYIAVIVTIICIIPILYWNFQNDFITYQYHSKRVMHTGISFANVTQQLIGEVLYQNPIVYAAVAWALFNFKKIKQLSNNYLSIHLLIYLSFPLLFIFWGVSLFNPTLPHWTGPGFISLFLIAGIYWSNQTSQIIPSILKWAIGFMGLVVVVFLSLVYVFPKQLGSKSIENLGEYNPINDVTGWRHFSDTFTKTYHQDQLSGKMSKKAPIITHKWFPGGHLLFYTAVPLGVNVIAIGPLEDIHKFAWLNKAHANLQIGQDAYFITPSNLPANPTVLYHAYFKDIQSIPDTTYIKTRGVILRNFYVYRMKNCIQIPASILP